MQRKIMAMLAVMVLGLTLLISFPSSVSADSSSVRSVTILRSDDSFGGSPDVLVGNTKMQKKKKQAAALKPFEKAVRSTAKNLDKATTAYFDRHDKSNLKKKNGWIWDIEKNQSKAMEKLNSGQDSKIVIPGIRRF